MRTIHDHKVNGLNEALQIVAMDQPGPGGANHLYSIYVPDSVPLKPGVTISVHVQFQNGPIGSPADINGISNEALLAVLIDRMRGFQHRREGEVARDAITAARAAGILRSASAAPAVAADAGFDFNSRGQYACRENACALTHLEEAMMWLQKRTRDRMARGVEGTHKV